MKKMYTFEKRNWISPALSAFALGAALLAAPAAQAQTKLEAEDGVLTGGAVKATTLMVYSGSGYVDYNGPSCGVNFMYTAATAGLYDLVIRYESQYDFKYGTLKVNAGGSSDIYFKSTKTATGAGFASTNKLQVRLAAGANTITIEGGYNYYGIDFITLAPSSTTVTALTPSASGRVEAELGQLFQAQSVVKDGEVAPFFSGSSYVTGSTSAAGSTIMLPITIATAGLYQVAVGARPYDSPAKSFDVAVTTGTSTGGKLTTSAGAGSSTAAFQSFVVGKYNLTAGTNTITISTQTGFVDIDYVDVTATNGVATAARAGADAQKTLAVFPNPATSQDLSVSLESATAQNASIELVNALGQRVLSTSRRLSAGANQFQLPTSRVAAGVYQLLVHRADQPVLSRRVMIAE